MLTIKLRRGTNTQWAVINPILADGEVGIESAAGPTPDKGKIGDGATPWNSLPYSISSDWVPLTQKGVAGGVATLDGSGLVPLNQLPDQAALDAEITAAVAAEAGLRQAADTALEAADTALQAAIVLRSLDSTVVHLTGAETITGLKTFTPSALGSVGVIVKGLPSQTGNLQQWQNSSGVVLSSVAADGHFEGSGAQCFVSNTKPVGVAGPYLWVETSGEKFTFWIEDGIAA